MAVFEIVFQWFSTETRLVDEFLFPTEGCTLAGYVIGKETDVGVRSMQGAK